MLMYCILTIYLAVGYTRNLLLALFGVKEMTRLAMLGMLSWSGSKVEKQMSFRGKTLPSLWNKDTESIGMTTIMKYSKLMAAKKLLNSIMHVYVCVDVMHYDAE